MAKHDFIKGGYGHGTLQCKYCGCTEREAAIVLGMECDKAPTKSELLVAFETFVAAMKAIPSTHEVGVCCCGDDISSHNEGSGHSPLDAGTHHFEQSVAAAEAAIQKELSVG